MRFRGKMAQFGILGRGQVHHEIKMWSDLISISYFECMERENSGPYFDAKPGEIYRPTMIENIRKVANNYKLNVLRLPFPHAFSSGNGNFLFPQVLSQFFFKCLHCVSDLILKLYTDSYRQKACKSFLAGL